MQNAAIFNDYDIVVSITQETLNTQLAQLTQAGIIHPELILVQEVQGGDFNYQVLTSASQIPRDDHGNPLYACIDAQITPRVAIAASGTNITFVLAFRAGTAYFWEGNGPLAQLVSYDMTGWKYGITVTLDLKAVEKADIGKGIQVPDLVKGQLYHFMDSMFTVNHLFMDFESTDLLRFDPNHTDTGAAGDKGTKALALFMQFYLTNLVKQGNPYILGYTICGNNRTTNVPDLLKPVGVTYTLYHDPQNAGRSNLNFVLVTKGGHGRIAGSPGNFDTNWIGPNEPCSGKIIYSHSLLVEPLLLHPVFHAIRQSVWTQIAKNISVPAGNTYHSARQITASGWKFVISNKTNGDDRYQNEFTVTVNNQGRAVTFQLQGHLYAYKEVSKGMFFCTAEAWASGTIDWNGRITLRTTTGSDGTTSLQADTAFVNNHPSTKHGQNSCADAFSWIGKIIGAVLDVFSLGLDGGFFSNLFSHAFSISTPGIGDLRVALQHLSSNTKNLVMLPTGQLFDYRNPESDSAGNVSLELINRQPPVPV